MAQVSKDMIIADIVDINIGCVPILMAEGKHCVGCPAAQAESLEEACMVHGIYADEMTKKLNDFLAEQED